MNARNPGEHRCKRAIVVLIAWLACGGAAAQGTEPLAADINEAVIDIPVRANGTETGEHMVATLYKPDGDGPFPFAILSHGRASTPAERAQVPRWRYIDTARWLVRRGLVVIVPTRRGYGSTGGADVEQSYNCANPSYREAVAGGVDSVLSVVDYAKALPFVNPERFILIGQSVGGLLTVAVTAAAPAGLAASINFAGGHGGDPRRHPGVPCSPEKLQGVYT
jgi:dienelactone hydrolase